MKTQRPHLKLNRRNLLRFRHQKIRRKDPKELKPPKVKRRQSNNRTKEIKRKQRLKPHLNNQLSQVKRKNKPTYTCTCPNLSRSSSNSPPRRRLPKKRI
jgi:hypothetical protein